MRSCKEDSGREMCNELRIRQGMLILVASLNVAGYLV